MTLSRNAPKAIEEETQRLVTTLERLGLAFQSGTINRAELILDAAQEIKFSAIRATAVAADGVEKLDRKFYGKLGAQLRSLYPQLRKAAHGKGRSPKQQINDLRFVARKLKPLFEEQNLYAKARFQKHSVGWRRLDPGADHCSACPGYATDGWVPLDQIVPVGVACPCAGNCRCNVTTRYDAAFDGDLANQILETAENRRKKEPSLEQIERLGFGRRRRR